eukprot:scaffold29409_cov44-Attheya_sp.AAC.3
MDQMNVARIMDPFHGKCPKFSQQVRDACAMLKDGTNSMTHISSADCCRSPAKEYTIVVDAYFDPTPTSMAYFIIIIALPFVNRMQQSEAQVGHTVVG